jgi:ArsR family transcriptional regulator, cadmium/lead-responsive transcriptional repressor
MRTVTHSDALSRFGCALSDPTRAEWPAAAWRWAGLSVRPRRQNRGIPPDPVQPPGLLRGCGLVVASPERSRYELENKRIAHALDDSAVSSAAAVAWQFTAKDPETREKAAVRFIACSFLALAAIYRQFGHPREGVGPPKLLAHRQSDRPAGRAGRPRAWCWTLTVTGVSPREPHVRSRPARSERTCPTAPASRRAGTAIHRPRPSGRSAAPSV